MHAGGRGSYLTDHGKLRARSRTAVRQAVEHPGTRRLTDGRGNSGDRSIRMIFNIHTLMINEAFLSGNLHTPAYAANKAPSRADQPPGSHWGRGKGRSDDEGDTHDNRVRHPLPDRSIPAGFVQEVCRELGPHHSSMRRT